MTCEQCRRQMTTDGLLSQLRCAECRQIQCESFCGLATKAALMVVSGIFGWLMARSLYSDPHHLPR